MSSPFVSIIMPAYNQDVYIHEAIDSILNQTLKDFELIIINDASTDSTAEVIGSFSDDRIRIINNDENLGITKSINLGIKTATGKYLARMDADDISLPERLQRQVEFLENNPDISVVGTAIELVDETGETRATKIFPATPLLVKWKLLFGFALAHPSAMARTEDLKENLYDESFINSQDYELWSRLLFKKGKKITNLKEVLLKYREHGQTASKQKPVERIKKSANLGVSNIKNYYQLNEAEEKLILAARLGTIRLFDLLPEKRLVKKIALEFKRQENPDESEKEDIDRFITDHFRFNLKAAIKNLLK